jgi:hypothetical protein
MECPLNDDNSLMLKRTIHSATNLFSIFKISYTTKIFMIYSQTCLRQSFMGNVKSDLSREVTGRKHLWNVLYEDCSFRPDSLTNMAATGNSCF